MAENQEPVADDVDEVRSDECPGDWADVIEGLQVAAKSEVEEERGSAVVERAEESDRQSEDFVVDWESHHEGRGADDDENENGGESGGEDETVKEPAVGLVEATGAVGLREVGVEAKKDASDTEGDSVVEDPDRVRRRIWPRQDWPCVQP